MGHTSTLRVLIDEALADKNTTLDAYVAEGTSDGTPLHRVHAELVHDTGIPVPLRTFYRWAERLEVAS